jgi:hypothetical protein
LTPKPVEQPSSDDYPLLRYKSLDLDGVGQDDVTGDELRMHIIHEPLGDDLEMMQGDPYYRMACR